MHAMPLAVSVDLAPEHVPGGMSQAQAAEVVRTAVQAYPGVADVDVMPVGGLRLGEPWIRVYRPGWRTSHPEETKLQEEIGPCVLRAIAEAPPPAWRAPDQRKAVAVNAALEQIGRALGQERR